MALFFFFVNGTTDIDTHWTEAGEGLIRMQLSFVVLKIGYL
jgi:hypothetical protein